MTILLSMTEKQHKDHKESLDAAQDLYYKEVLSNQVLKYIYMLIASETPDKKSYSDEELSQSIKKLQSIFLNDFLYCHLSLFFSRHLSKEQTNLLFVNTFPSFFLVGSPFTPKEFLKTPCDFLSNHFDKGELVYFLVLKEKEEFPLLKSQFIFFGKQNNNFCCKFFMFLDSSERLMFIQKCLVPFDSILPQKSKFMRNAFIISGLLVVVGFISSFFIYRKYKA